MNGLRCILWGKHFGVDMWGSRLLVDIWNLGPDTYIGQHWKYSAPLYKAWSHTDALSYFEEGHVKLISEVWITTTSNGFYKVYEKVIMLFMWKIPCLINACRSFSLASCKELLHNQFRNVDRCWPVWSDCCHFICCVLTNTLMNYYTIWDETETWQFNQIQNLTGLIRIFAFKWSFAS